MNKQYTEKAIMMTHQLLQDYYQKKPETVFSLCTENMTWIGAQAEQFDIGFEAFKKDILAITKKMFCCKLLHQEFVVTQNRGNVCTVIGRYLVESDDENVSAAAPQRCVVVWEKIGNDLKIRHLSTFNPLDTIKAVEGENFVRHMGEYIEKYIQRKMKTLSKDKTVKINDDQNVMHFVPLCDIIWAETQGRKCVIHVIDKKIEAKMSLAELTKQLDDDFLQIHRCYFINVHYVKEMKPFCIVLLDGTELGVPQRRYNEIKNDLLVKRA